MRIVDCGTRESAKWGDCGLRIAGRSSLVARHSSLSEHLTMAVDIVQEIKLRTDLVDLIGGYVQLRPSGRTFKGLCPFHGEKTPSFHVDRERGFFRCYGCGAGGDCFTFLEKQEGLSFNEAGELLSRRLGMEWVRLGDTQEKRSERERLYDVNALVERFYRQCLEQEPGAAKYLERRGLAPETVSEFRLGYAPPGYEALLGWLRRQKVSIEDALKADVLMRSDRGELRDRFVDRVIFPLFDVEGRTAAFAGRTLHPDGVPKYLNSRETPIFQKGRMLYGLHLARKAIGRGGDGSSFVVVVEGYMDLIALHQAGVSNSVACMGTAITENHVGVLRRYSDHLVFCYDGDAAGMRAVLRNSPMFEKAGVAVRVARLPEGEDPDTYMKAHGADAFRALLSRAEPLLDYQLSQLRAGYNLSDEKARLPFVREAARAIAQSGSHLVRQEYAGRLVGVLDRLADEWYPGDPHRAMQARVALAQEVSRLLRMERLNGRPPGSNGHGVAPPAAPAPARPGGVALAERYVLRAALTEGRWAEAAAARLTPGYFSVPELRPLAGALLGGADGAAEDIRDRADAVRNNPANAEAVSALLVEETPLSDAGLEECIDALERSGKQRRKQELQRAIEAGEIPPGDPRLDEYRKLAAALGGRQRRED